MYGALDISTSGMVAQRIRHESIAANIANQDAILDAAGRYNPYRRRQVFFAPGDPGARTAQGRRFGVHVADITADAGALRPEYDPTNRFADANGYVLKPDINPVVEQTNAMQALRAYEANVVAAQATKSMIAQALRLIA